MSDPGINGVNYTGDGSGDSRHRQKQCDAFLDSAGELDLMGHNLIFDYSFLKHQAARSEDSLLKKWN